jgi:hypothetical protein
MARPDLHKLEAEVFGAALSQGLLGISSVVRWADSIVANEPEPDPTILAVSVDSLGSRFDRLDALESLSRVSGQATVADVTNAFLGLLYILLDRDRSLSTKFSTLIYGIMNGIEPVQTPGGLTLEAPDEEAYDVYQNIDRELSATDLEEWYPLLLNFLLRYAAYAKPLHVPA